MGELAVPTSRRCRRHVVVGCLQLACLGAGWGCGSDGRIAVRYGLWARPGEAQFVAAEKFKEELESRSSGRFAVSIYPGNQLGTPPEELEQLALNAIQVFASGWAGIDEIEYLALPYLMRSVEGYVSVIEGPIGQQWDDKLVAQSGVRLLGFLARSPRQITANRIVDSMDDLDGLKIRVAQRDYYVQTFLAFGARPTPMAFGEVYTSLQTGVVDGQENPIETIYAQKYFEVQESIAIVDYITKPAYVMVGEPFWRELSDTEREWFRAAQRASESYLVEALPRQQAELLAEMRKAGITITHPDQQSFIDATQEVRDRLGTRVWGEALYREIARIGREVGS